MGQYIKRDDGAVINNDDKDFQKFKLKREKAMREKLLEERVSKLERELIQVRKILQERLN